MITLYYPAEYAEQCQQWQIRLTERGVAIHSECVEKINAKFLRLHPQLALALDDDGLSLCYAGMKMNPDWQAEIPRLKRATLKTEMLARACQANEHPTVIDATAGLGHDSLLMAQCGANVILLERHPILFSLLEYQLQLAQQDPFLSQFTSRLQLHFADAKDDLQQRIATAQSVDVVYLDPMFPQRHQNNQKKAQVKKQMQVLHHLLEDEMQQGEQNPQHIDLGDALLPLAQQLAKRVIVKRPRHAIFLNQQEPQHQWLGDACRFDGYFQG
ncbi:MAG: class I SAM-dependent methyltransferase [Acinetobacter sp.]|nr:class I SAM-dependent methyltransferase [Acinetobacter sp.]